MSLSTALPTFTFPFRILGRILRRMWALLRRRRRAVWITIITASLLALLWHLFATRGYQQAEGTYIAGGGRYFVKIGKGLLYGNLRFNNGIILDEFIKDFEPPDINPEDTTPYSSSRYYQSAYSRNRHLFIEQFASEESYGIAEDFQDFSWSTRGNQYHLRLKLAPSATVPGDWDLVDAEMSKTMLIGHDLSLYNWERLFNARSWHSAYLQCVGLFGIDQTQRYAFAPAKGSVKSFLHRLDDERITPYFKARLYGKSDRTLSMIRDLAALHPSDPWLVPHQIELESRSGDLAQADALLKQWQPILSKTPDTLLRDAFNASRRWLEFAHQRRDHPDLAPLADLCTIPELDKENKLLPSRMDLAAQRQWMLQSYATGIIPKQPRPLVEPVFYHMREDARSSEPPEDSNHRMEWIYNQTKIFYTLAMFDLLRGKQDESMDLLSNCYLIGQRLSTEYDGEWFREYQGVFARRTALKGLTTLVLNSCESPAELQPLKARLDQFHAMPFRSVGWFQALPASLLPLMQTTFDMEKGIQDWDVTTRRVKADLEMLRLAVSAREHQLATGDFPSSANQLQVRLKDGIPADPFLESTPLRHQRADGDYLVYSAGPDRKDDGGALTYDPTNGTISAGDMIVRIPRQRRYPFPSGPVHATSAADLFRQFPHGLPDDAFAYFKHPLKVLDSSGTLPVIIFSERPGNEEQPPTGLNDNRLAYEAPGTTATLPAGWRLAAPYDPTNGSYSQGDLFLELPK